MLKYVLIGLVLGVLLSSAVVSLAGNLEPSDPPETTSSYTLQDIYHRLDTGAPGSPSVWAEPEAGPGATGHTLNEVMAIAPELDDAHGATATQVLSGTTVWGLTSEAWGPITGTLEWGYPSGVPRTGQALCWNSNGQSVPCSGSGQDGDYQMGVAWPNPRFADNGDGTVTDNLTGLTWLKDAGCMGEMHWGDAANDAFGMLGRLNGGEDFSCADYVPGTFDDWRMPNVREMYSLVDYGVYDPAVPNTSGTGKWSDGDPFVGVQSLKYWTSTTRTGYHHHVWLVYLYIGDVEDGDKFYTYYLWPVRGGQ